MRTSREVQQAEGLLADKWADFVSWFARSALDVQSHSVSSLKTAFNQSGECGGGPVSMDGRLPGAAVTTVPTLVSRVPPVPHSFHCSPLFSLFRCSRAPGRLTAESGLQQQERTLSCCIVLVSLSLLVIFRGLDGVIESLSLDNIAAGGFEALFFCH